MHFIWDPITPVVLITGLKYTVHGMQDAAGPVVELCRTRQPSDRFGGLPDKEGGYKPWQCKP